MGSSNELLIASVSPQNLERGFLWFSENHDAVKQALGKNPWWQTNTVVLRQELRIRESDLIRRIMDLGYERAATVRGKGLFAVRGGIVEIWPINTQTPFLIEFVGNAIATIAQQAAAREIVAVRSRASTPSLAKLLSGSFVVHIDHGIGVYRGIEEQHAQDRAMKQTYFVVEYAPPKPGHEPDRLYVPTDQEDRLKPYVGLDMPRVHRLGGTVWAATKRKVKAETEKLARELLALYARRHLAQRPPYHGDPTLEDMLHESFPYQETEDQLRAEREIMKDLEQSTPMDRVLCGDVGFGKTEIAIRAALRIIVSGKQVIVLTPTTVLAAQHEKTFTERFADLPVRIGMLSRLNSPHEQARVIHAMGNGSIDCVIGTHRLLSRDIAFANLGLVVIDEEQRFGVKQKEHLKNLRAEVDVLSLSATPIPRTMHLALAKLRDLSQLSSPPAQRLAIHTHVLPYTQKTIRAALEYELERKGQVYFLHNRVETIMAAKERLEKFLNKSSTFPRDIEPRAKVLDKQKNPRNAIKARKPRIGILHGRMQEKQMVAVMAAFRAGEIDILLATTIIENGLDISSANTLIVDDAVRLGLAQAHQLRGRVGRGTQQAFAYFLYRPRNLTPQAADRLEALQEYATLGAGYELALRDLEIRGAGNMLGKEQSGALNKVGLNLYYQMLAEAIEDVKTANSL